MREGRRGPEPGVQVPRVDACPPGRPPISQAPTCWPGWCTPRTLRQRSLGGPYVGGHAETPTPISCRSYAPGAFSPEALEYLPRQAWRRVSDCSQGFVGGGCRKWLHWAPKEFDIDCKLCAGHAEIVRAPKSAVFMPLTRDRIPGAEDVLIPGYIPKWSAPAV